MDFCKRSSFIKNILLIISNKNLRDIKKKWMFLKTVYHFIACVLYYYVANYGLKIQFTTKAAQAENSQLDLITIYAPCFLTNWNLIFQTVFLSLSLIYDVLEWLDKHETRLAKKIRYFRDVIFCGAVVPCTLFVSSMFWTLFLIDRELVFPEVYDRIVPWWFNHCVHTNITILLLLETLIQARRHPTDLKVELILNGVIGISYAIVYYSIYFFANRWLYAVFGIFTWWQVCLFQIMIWTSFFVFYYIQFPINRLFHKEEKVLNAPVATTEDIANLPGLHKNRSQENGFQKIETPDVQVPPFSTDLTSLKHRSNKNECENSNL